MTSYDYHPPLPLPDSELPEKSLGDCAICMDTIMVDPSLRRRSKSSDQRGNWDDKGPSFMKGNSIGVNVTTARNHYSLAPCSHLFVSFFWPFPGTLLNRNFTEPTESVALRQHTECLEKVCARLCFLSIPLILDVCLILLLFLFFYSVACNKGIFYFYFLFFG